jgi:hypothetical protein
MTEEDRLQWGAQEDAQRKADLVSVKAGGMTLEAAQKAAQRRMRAAGMTLTKAYHAVRDGRKRAEATRGTS